MCSPDFDDIGDRWFAAMRAGDFAEAWRLTDRIESQPRAREGAGLFVWEPNDLEWNCTPFDDRRVLVRCKHGLMAYDMASSHLLCACICHTDAPASGPCTPILEQPIKSTADEAGR